MSEKLWTPGDEVSPDEKDVVETVEARAEYDGMIRLTKRIDLPPQYRIDIVFGGAAGWPDRKTT